MLHEKKILPEYFQEILDGKKNFELRLADWDCREGDVLLLREWDQKIKDYTGRSIRKKASYVLKTKDLDFFSQEDLEKYGYQIISLQDE